MDKDGGPFRHGAVPVPNRLFDDVLPGLSDTELRVLLIVLRQTLGWREGDERGGWRHRRRDWMSHAQLCRKTGRRSEAVSNAVNGLVSKGLIVAETGTGSPLPTPEMRRRHLGRVYLRVVDMWITARSLRPGKAKTTTDSLYNKEANDSQVKLMQSRDDWS
jgi:hypothetical protein